MGGFGEKGKLLFESGLGGCQAGHWEAERGTGDIGQPKAVTEFYGIRFAPVFAADS
jgi:hypothetical protein